MKSKHSIVVFLFLTICSFSQVKNPKASDQRFFVDKMEKLNSEMEKYVLQQFSKHQFPAEFIKKVKAAWIKEFHSKNSKLIDLDAAFALYLDNLKKNHLRNQFIKDNASNFEQLRTYTSSEVEYPDICTGGTFEEGLSSDFGLSRYNFIGYEYFDCSFDFTTSSPLILPEEVNNMSPEFHISLTDSGTGPSQVCDSLSASVCIPVSSGEGMAIRLNNAFAPGDTNLSSRLSKTFIVDSEEIYYDFSFVCENPQDHDPDLQPRFIVRLFDSNKTVISENCIVSNVANTAMFSNATGSTTNPLLYTNWQCANISTGDLLSRPLSERVATIEFIVTDCGLGGHYGYVYLDNICTNNCANPFFGEISLNLNPTEITDCPTTNINICGTFSSPRSQTVNPVTNQFDYASLANNGLILEIIDSAGNVVSTIDANSVPNYPQIQINQPASPNTFCFQIGEQQIENLLAGTYEYRVTANFTLNNFALTLSDDSSNPSSDLNLADCTCPNEIIITDAVTNNEYDSQEATIRIEALNKISGNQASAAYHAGSEIILKNGFEVFSGAVFSSIIDPCGAEFQLRQGSTSKTTKVYIPESQLIPLIVESGAQLSLYPNPSNSVVNILLESNLIRSITLLDIYGKTVWQQSFTKQTLSSETQINVSELKNGWYILRVETEKGDILTSKLFKN